ncbi:MAG: helix-turn-helix domain-containing protein [Sedimentisphaerales bacterium]
MAGMFYSLQEVIEKLGKTEAQIKTLVREGKLREFRDGSKQLYKVEDVDALAAVPKEDAAVLDDSLKLAIDETGEVSLAPEEIDVLMGDDDKKNESKFKLDETGELVADEVLGKSEKEKTSILPTAQKKDKPIDLEALSKEETKANQPKQKGGSTAGGTDIFAEPAEKEEITTDDTKISLSGDSINVLGESDTEFKISDDTSGETKLVQKGPKTLDGKGKGEGRLDEDVNLDGYGGSGSGLLDLSLQADDTSLGAVLDDIYPESPAAATPLEQTPPPEDAAVAQEAEKIFEDAEPQPIEQAAVQEAAATAAAFIAEPPPDAASNIFGITLFVPLIALIYTTIVVASGYKPILKLKILSSIEPIIWYVTGGAAGLVILIVLVGSFMSGGGGPKPPKVKQPKPPKVKKEKKAKKEKEAPAKEG